MGGKKFLRIGPLGFALILATIGNVYLCIPKEPRYHGRSYTAWLAITEYYDRFPAPPGQNAQWWEAVNAVNEIGTNAAPYLAEQLLSPSSSEAKSLALVSWMNRHAPAHYHIRSDRERIELAKFGVWLLKDKRKALCPFFVEATRSSDSERREQGNVLA